MSDDHRQKAVKRFMYHFSIPLVEKVGNEILPLGNETLSLKVFKD